MGDTTKAPDGGDPLGLVARTAPLASARLLALRDHWLAMRGDRAIPARGDLDPLDIPRLLSNLVLVEVHHDAEGGSGAVGDSAGAPRFRYRLIGTAVTRMVGRESTGRWIDADLYGERAPLVARPYRRVVATGTPLALRRQVQLVEKDWIFAEIVLLPLAGADGRVDLVLTGFCELGDRVEKPPIGTTFVLDWRLGSPAEAAPTGRPAPRLGAARRR